jgi:hypothetical protein
MNSGSENSNLPNFLTSFMDRGQGSEGESSQPASSSEQVQVEPPREDIDPILLELSMIDNIRTDTLACCESINNQAEKLGKYKDLPFDDLKSNRENDHGLRMLVQEQSGSYTRYMLNRGT